MTRSGRRRAGRAARGFSELAAQRLNLRLAEKPELAAPGAFDYAGLEKLAQPLGAVAQVFSGDRKQYQAILPVHVTSIWPYPKFYTLRSWRYAKYWGIIGVVPNSGGSMGLAVLMKTPPTIPQTVRDWLDLTDWKRPHWYTYTKLRFQIMVQISNTRPEVARECRLWHANAIRRGKIVEPLEYGPFYSSWPGWDDLIPPIPSDEEAYELWYERNPAVRRTNPARLITASTRFKVLDRDGFKCRYCGRRSPDVELHLDHVFPVSKGGTATVDNLVTACADCNLGKHDAVLTTPVEA